MLRMHSTMDVIMPPPPPHTPLGARNYALCLECIGPWTLSAPPTPLTHPCPCLCIESDCIKPCYHGWAVDAQLGPGCFVRRMH